MNRFHPSPAFQIPALAAAFSLLCLQVEPALGDSPAEPSKTAPHWRMQSAPAAQDAPSAPQAPRWRMSSSPASQESGAPTASSSAPLLSSGAPSGDSGHREFFMRAADSLRREESASTSVRPNLGESEFGRLQIPSASFDSGAPASGSNAADPESSPDSDSEPAVSTAPVSPAPQAKPRPMWQPSFVDTLVPTRRRSRSDSTNPWSYPEAGRYAGSEAYVGPAGPTPVAVSDEVLVFHDDAPDVYTQAESADLTPASERAPWFVFGRSEEYRQNPWAVRYPAARFRGPTIPSRAGSVMGEVRHFQPSGLRSRPFFEERNPAGPYVYEFDDIDDPFEDWEEVEALGETRLHVRGALGPLRQWYDPGMAHVKAGPVYLEALWAETGFLYSDFSGTTRFPAGKEDGWLGYASFAMRGAARLFKDAFLVLNGEVIYLIGENRVGLRALESLGGPSAIAQLDYYGQWGEWDVHLFDRIGTAQFFDLDFMIQNDAFEQAGRYVLGFPGDARSRDFLLYDPIVYNQVGIDASRPVGELFQTSLWYTHSDFYYTEWDDSHRHLENVGASFGAASGKVPFNPTLSYNGVSPDHFDSMGHALYLSGTGAITNRLSLSARGGYLWNELATNNFEGDHWLWSVGLRHRITSKSFHYVTVGQDFFWRDFTDDSSLADFVQYGFNHRFSDRLYFGLFAQWSTDEFLTGEFTNREFDRQAYGARIDFQVIDDIFLYLGYRFEDVDEERTGFESDRQIVNATAYVRLTERSVSYVGYQFEKFDSSTTFFDEHLWQAGVRRYF